MGFIPPPLAPRTAFKSDDEWYRYNKFELDNMRAKIPTVGSGLLIIFTTIALVLFMVFIFS